MISDILNYKDFKVKLTTSFGCKQQLWTSSQISLRRSAIMNVNKPELILNFNPIRVILGVVRFQDFFAFEFIDIEHGLHHPYVHSVVNKTE